jgi:hypothetical protein
MQNMLAHTYRSTDVRRYFLLIVINLMRGDDVLWLRMVILNYYKPTRGGYGKFTCVEPDSCEMFYSRLF